MKKIVTLLLLVSYVVQSQQKIFETQLSENLLPKANQLSADLKSTYLATKYYRQDGFELNQNLLLQLPDNSIIEALYQYPITHSAGTFSAVYKIRDEPGGELIFSRAENTITGMYISDQTRKIIFQQTGPNVFAVSEVNESVFRQKESPFDFVAGQDDDNNRNIQAHPNICLASTPVCSGTTVVDLMVVYTPSARTLWGGSAAANSAITSAVSNMNVSLINSGITNGISFNLVYVGEVAYGESGSFNTDLSRLRNVGDGFLDEVHTLRTNYGADLVGLAIGSPNDLCGLGYLNTASTDYSNTRAFTVTLYSCFLSNITFAHEVGHNMGFNHDWYVAPGALPCSHHHGYINRLAIQNGSSGPSSQKWRTIMAYTDECTAAGTSCPKINRWANPEIMYNGQPTGIAIGPPNPSDEAFGMRRAACVVAGFMPTVLGTDEYTSVSFSVYPNPAREQLNIICDKEIGEVKISNQLGQFVLGSREKLINTEMLSSGVYFVKIYDESGKSLGVRKVIKE